MKAYPVIWISVAVTALALAGPALGLSGFDDVAGAVCEAVPDDAPGEIADAFADRDTSALDATACAKLCRAVANACSDRAKNIADCHADMNKRQAKVEEGACIDDKDCAKTAKDARKLDDRNAKENAKGVKNVCKQLESDCQDSCEAGTLLPS